MLRSREVDGLEEEEEVLKEQKCNVPDPYNANTIFTRL